MQFVNFLRCTVAIEALTPLSRASCKKIYKNIDRSRLFWRIAKRYNIVTMLQVPAHVKYSMLGVFSRQNILNKNVALNPDGEVKNMH